MIVATLVIIVLTLLISSSAKRHGISSTKYLLCSLGVFILPVLYFILNPLEVRGRDAMGNAIMIALGIYVVWATIIYLVCASLMKTAGLEKRAAESSE